MTTKKRGVSAAERGVLQSLERVCKSYSEQGSSGRTFVVRQPDVCVRKIREDLRMSQSEFASKFGISIKTIRNWEQGISKPEGASRAYLLVIKHDSDAVLRALKAEGPQVYEVHSEPCA